MRAWYALLDSRGVPNSYCLEGGMKIRMSFFRVAGSLLALGFGLAHVAQVNDSWADDGEVYTQKLSQSTTGYDFWTTTPGENG